MFGKDNCAIGECICHIEWLVACWKFHRVNLNLFKKTYLIGKISWLMLNKVYFIKESNLLSHDAWQNMYLCTVQVIIVRNMMS